MKERSYKKELFKIAVEAIRIFDFELVHYGGEVYGLFTGNIRKDTNSVWVSLKKAKAFGNLVSKLAKYGNKHETTVENLLCEFIYDVVDAIATKIPRPEQKQVKHEIQNRVNLVVDELKSQGCTLNAIAPLFQFESDVSRILIGDITIRPVRYLEHEEYKPRYPEAVAPYGPQEFDWIIHLACLSDSKVITNETMEYYMTWLGNIIMGIRLLCGGSAGVEYLDIDNNPSLDEQEIGDIVQFGKATIRSPRTLRPGEQPSNLASTIAEDFILFVNALDVLDSSRSDFIWRALRRYGNAIESLMMEDKAIDLVIALECLLGGGRTQAVIRAATLVTEEPGLDEDAQGLLDDCWKARHALVHGRSFESAEEEAGGDLEDKTKKLAEIVRKCLLVSVVMNPAKKREFWESIDLASQSETSKKAILAQIPPWVENLINYAHQ